MLPTKRQIPVKYSIFSEFSHLQVRYLLRHQRALLRGLYWFFQLVLDQFKSQLTITARLNGMQLRGRACPGPSFSQEHWSQGWEQSLFLHSAVPHSSGSKLDPNTWAGTDQFWWYSPRILAAKSSLVEDSAAESLTNISEWMQCTLAGISTTLGNLGGNSRQRWRVGSASLGKVLPRNSLAEFGGFKSRPKSTATLHEEGLTVNEARVWQPWECHRSRPGV